MGPQTWRWKKLTPQVILVAGLCNTSSMEPWVMFGIDMEIKWTASPASPNLSPLSSEALNHDGPAHPGRTPGDLGGGGNVLAQHRAASSEIPDDNST